MSKQGAHPGAKDRSAAELEALLGAAVDAIVVIDEDGTIVAFNEAAESLFGYDAAEVKGENVEMLMPEPYRSQHSSYLRRYLDTGQAHVIGTGREAEGQKCGGDTFPIWLSVGEALYDDSRHFVGIVRDLTALREAERERHELETNLARVGRFSLMGEMAAGIAHEINQPLSAIANYSQAAKRMLATRHPEPADLEQACSGIAEQVERAAEVIENLRRFIKKQDVSMQQVDLNDVILSAMSLVVPDAKSAGVPVSTELAEDLPPVSANPIQLQQVLLNLTRNAVDAMQQSLRKKRGVLIRAGRMAPGRVFFAVTDHGSGVSERIAEAIFHPFVTTKKDGLGVGLAISQTIVRAHGGELAYEPNPDGGSIFTVSLPISLKESGD